MTQKATEIEVEVLEIDGATPVAPKTRSDDEAPPQGDWHDWRNWQGHVRRLDSRWWPLWTFLGIIALVLILTVGIVIGAIYLVFRVLQGFIRMIQG